MSLGMVSVPAWGDEEAGTQDVAASEVTDVGAAGDGDDGDDGGVVAEAGSSVGVPSGDREPAADADADPGGEGPVFGDAVGDVVAGLEGEGEFVGDPEDPVMVDEPVLVDVDDAVLAHVWVKSDAGDEAGLVVDADGVELVGVDVRGQAYAGLVVDGDGVVVRDSVIRAGSGTTLAVVRGSSLRVEGSKLGLPRDAAEPIVTVRFGSGPTRIDMDGVEFCPDCYESAMEAGVRYGGCSSCPFIAGCSSGRNLIHTFLSSGDYFAVSGGKGPRARSDVVVDARRVYWGPGGPRMAGNPGGRGIRIDARPGVRVNVRPWLVVVSGPVGATISAPAATRSYSLGKRPYVYVPQGSKVTITQGARRQVLRPMQDTTVTRVT